MNRESTGYAPQMEDGKQPHAGWKDSGADREKLVMRNQAMVKDIAARIKEKLPAHVELDDLVSAGNVGLLEAADRYEPDKGVGFYNYAKLRVSGAILDSLRKLDWASRDMRKNRKVFEAAVGRLEQEFGRAPNDEEIAQSMGLDEAAFRKLMIDLSTTGPVSLGSVDFTEAVKQVEPADKHRPNPEQLAMRAQMRRLLEAAVEKLPPKYRTVITEYYSDDDLTMKAIGGQLGVGESRVSQMHKDALEKLRTALGEKGSKGSKDFIQ